MRAINAECVGHTPDGKQIMQAMILADKAPTALPDTGQDVVGMTKEQVFAPFSVLYVVGEADNKVYIANEAGKFIPQ